MIYGIIADIHSNLEAFEAVLSQLQTADCIICLGDVVGYGPNPNECINKIRELKIPCVAGNHDKAVTGEKSTEWFNPNAQKVVTWTQAVIAENNLEFLRGLPEVREEDRFYCVHGSLVSPLDEYVTGVAEAIQTFNLMSKPLCFIGHSHRPLFIACRTDGNYDGKILKDKDEILTSDYKKVIINVGGVGQPRDGDPRASFGVYDTSTDLFSLQRVTYDFEKTQQKMIQAGLPQFLIDRLQFGK